MPARKISLAIAAVALGRALQVRNGFLSAEAIVWLTVAIAACVVGIAKIESASRVSEKALTGVLAAGLLFQFAQLCRRVPALYLHIEANGYAAFFLGIGCAAILTALLFLPWPRWRGLVFALLLIVHAGLGTWIIRKSPEPLIDVYVIQREAANFLVTGLNPYAAVYPDVYNGQSAYYSSEVAKEGWLLSGIGYPPLSLLLSLPGHVLLHDFRYSGLAALLAAAALIAGLSPGRNSFLAAALFLFTPRIFLVVEQGWTEPYVVLLLASAVWCASRRSRFLPVAFGLLIAVKQYLLLALCPAALLLAAPFNWRRYGRFVATALAVAALTALPFLLWDAGALVRSLVGNVAQMPFRPDANSYPAALARLTGYRAPGWVALLAVFPAAIFAMRRAPRTPVGFCAATALVFLVLFAFSTTPMLNYYFFVIGALCCGVAAAA